ncbi:hypothetical protein [Paenibacillus odorifer]|uniref:hypothetical protein n=1 Tax=Paenibacillus odorifer TaxID=189426 RepID=UPI00096E85B5|nr:hypothetical protein [Paenibacillus odorifer]OME55137.1 hypothetical protein BSK61_13805 [Paenibacillus odorifer]
MLPIKWKDRFGEDHVFMVGQGDDVFHVIPNKRDEEDNSHVEILSKQALIEISKVLTAENI